MKSTLLEALSLIFIASTAYSDKTMKNGQWIYDYCDLTCNGTMHTMCEYPKGGGDACDNNLKVYLTKSEKVYIEDNMNGIRQRIAQGQMPGYPESCNMMKLVWDRELSTIAKRWADQCTQPKHDVCRLTSDEEATGQTVYIGKYKNIATGPPARMSRIRENLEVWANEERLFDKSWIHSYNSSTEDYTGNFSQVIWANTEYVGCGYTEFQMKGYVTSRFVCNFKRKGNVPESSVYRAGKPCSKCPSRTKCSQTFKGMCWNGKFSNYADINDDDIAQGHRLQLTLITFILMVFSVILTLLHRLH